MTVYTKKDSWPRNLASRTEWEERGYRVRKGEKPAARARWWNVQSYQDYKLYDLNQCDPIRGRKAEQRRFKFTGEIEQQP